VTCHCGSGEESWWENDSQGIPLAKVCGVCRAAALSRFWDVILTGYTQDDVSEPIEETE
jgi:hypothetical protein